MRVAQRALDVLPAGVIALAALCASFRGASATVVDPTPELMREPRHHAGRDWGDVFPRVERQDPAVAEHLDAADRHFGGGALERAAAELEAATALAPQRPSLHTALAEIQLRLGWYHDALLSAERALALAPAAAQPYDIIGTAHLGLGDTRRAIEAYREVIRRAPHRAIGYLHLGNALFASGAREDALTQLNTALSIDSGLIEALRKTAVLLQVRGDHAAASERARAVLARRPDDAFAHSVLANAHLAAGEIERARHAYEKAVALRPRSIYFRELLGRFHASQGEYLEAILIFSGIVNDAPKHASAHEALADLYGRAGKKAPAAYHLGYLALSKGHTEEAIRQYRRALAWDPTLTGAYLDLVVVYLAVGDLAKAADAVERALALNARDPVTLTLLGDVRRRQGNIADAETAYRSAVAANGASASAHLRLGELLAVAGRCGEALPVLRAAARLDRASTTAFKRMGDCLQALGRQEAAIAVYRQVLVREPGHVGALNSLASLYGERGEKLDLALRLAEGALARRPDDPAIADTLGWLHYLNGHPGTAAELLERAAAALPGEPTVLYHLGATLHRLGDNGAAAEKLRAALRSGRDFPEREETRLLLSKVSKRGPDVPAASVR